MKANIQNNYKNIRELIKSNVDTIVVLVEQAQGLEKIVDSISGSEADKELKQKLEKQLDDLRSTIAQLVSQTEDLFRSYDEMVESALN
jgi:flagellar basal body-associated protein FliL